VSRPRAWPGSTASCAFGRSSNISTTAGNGEKSRSPKISRVGTGRERSSSVHPGELAHQCLRLGRDLVEVRGVGSDRVVGVAHRLEVGRCRHAVVVEWRSLPARRAVGVRRGNDQLADPGGRAERDRVRDEAAEAERTDRPRRSPDGRAARRCHRPAPRSSSVGRCRRPRLGPGTVASAVTTTWRCAARAALRDELAGCISSYPA
jgi:hypothetical protein